jgi:hypothetical protein
MTIHLKISIAFATLMLLIVFGLCFVIGGDAQSHYLNIAVFVFSWALGWLLGTMIAPYDSGEATLFSRVSKAVSAFASGYLLAKMDELTKSLFDPAFILQPVVGFRALEFASVTTIIMIVVFFARKYSDWHRLRGGSAAPSPSPPSSAEGSR